MKRIRGTKFNPNVNHPKKDSQIKVEPITDIKKIKTIKKILSDRPRDLCLFTIGINTNLRASDLRQIKVSEVKGLKPDEDFEIKEMKTKKNKRVTLNKTCVEAIQKLLDSKEFKSDYLFESQRGVLTVSSINRLVKEWTSEIGLKGNFGSHTLRKTWGYMMRTKFCVDIPTLMECFNHSSQKQTLDYLCVQPEEIKDVFKHCL